MEGSRDLKILLFILLFAISAFAGEINIPKGIGDVDGAVYTADGKTLYTLKNETVTKWSVEPLKQLDTFETTVNHLRDYVSEEIDKNYLEELTKNYKFRPIVLDEKGDELTVSSQYVSETWNLKSKKLFFGGPRGIKRIYTIFKEQKHMLNPIYLSIGNYAKNVKQLRSVKLSADNIPYYELYFNINFNWYRKDSQLLSLFMHLNTGIFPKHEITTILTMTDDITLTYHSILTDQTEKSKKAADIVTTRIMLEKVHSSDPYSEVWKTKNAHEAMEKLYGTTKSQAFVPNKYDSKAELSGYSMRATYGLDFTSLLVSNSLEEGGAPYPMMILHSDVIDLKSPMSFTLRGNQRIRSHGIMSSINFTMIGKIKDQKVYEWNTVIPGSPGDL